VFHRGAYNVIFPPTSSILRFGIQESDTHWPCVTDTVIDGKPAYSTNDLMIRHPTNKSLWKMYGRTDDQIMHSTGEKVS
jgi:hypothetical protein